MSIRTHLQSNLFQLKIREKRIYKAYNERLFLQNKVE